MKEDPIKTAFMLTIVICWHRISEPSYLYPTNSKRYNFKLSQDSNVIPLKKKKVTSPSTLLFSGREAGGLRSWWVSLFPQNVFQASQLARVCNLCTTTTVCFTAPGLPIVGLNLGFMTLPHPVPVLGGAAAVPGSTQFSPRSHREYLHFCGTWHFASRINISSLIFSPFPSSCFMCNDVLLEVCSRGVDTMGWIYTHKFQK